MRAGNGADVSARTSGVYEVDLEQPPVSSVRAARERPTGRPREIARGIMDAGTMCLVSVMLSSSRRWTCPIRL